MYRNRGFDNERLGVEANTPEKLQTDLLLPQIEYARQGRGSKAISVSVRVVMCVLWVWLASMDQNVF